MKTLLWKALCLLMCRLTMRFGHKSHWTYSLGTLALTLWTVPMWTGRYLFDISFPHRWHGNFNSPLQLYLRCDAREWILMDFPQSGHSFRFFKWTASRCNFRYDLVKDLPQSGHFWRILKWTCSMCSLRFLRVINLSQYSHLAVRPTFCSVGESFEEASSSFLPSSLLIVFMSSSIMLKLVLCVCVK